MHVGGDRTWPREENLLIQSERRRIGTGVTSRKKDTTDLISTYNVHAPRNGPSLGPASQQQCVWTTVRLVGARRDRISIFRADEVSTATFVCSGLPSSDPQTLSEPKDSGSRMLWLAPKSIRRRAADRDSSSKLEPAKDQH